jgi:ankyrin repeat protein
MININVLTIRRETPLHIACEYASSKIDKQLIEFDCDLFETNVDGHNCFEVAIKAHNGEVVRYLINNDNCFDLMLNSQIREKNAPTVLLWLYSYSTKSMTIHKSIFMYEFLEDQFIIKTCNTSKKILLFEYLNF